MPSVKYLIELTDADRKILKDIVAKGSSSTKTILRANILLGSQRQAADDRCSDRRCVPHITDNSSDRQGIICEQRP